MLRDQTKLVSILIPCYNARQWIGDAIRSALGQTWPNKEVLVVDDGSTDDSLSVIRSFGSAIRFETGPNRGGNVVRNRLLETAAGEWLQYLDADDYLHSDKVARQMEFLSANPDTDIVYGPVTHENCLEPQSRFDVHAIPEPHDPWVLLALWYLPQTGAPLWRKQALKDVGCWKPDQPCCQEHELYLRLLMANKRFAYCEHNGAVYRQWGDHTVCKRDKPEVHRRRLEIEQRAEDWLCETGGLTPLRLRAINQARFETARTVWQYDREYAAAIMRSVRKSEPRFIPSGSAAPAGYRAAYRVLGFHLAERVAGWKRGWLKHKSAPQESIRSH
jgi:glycosyltransferase involved in cell wall biosynthesis